LFIFMENNNEGGGKELVPDFLIIFSRKRESAPSNPDFGGREDSGTKIRIHHLKGKGRWTKGKTFTQRGSGNALCTSSRGGRGKGEGGCFAWGLIFKKTRPYSYYREGRKRSCLAHDQNKCWAHRRWKKGGKGGTGICIGGGWGLRGEKGTCVGLQRRGGREGINLTDGGDKGNQDGGTPSSLLLCREERGGRRLQS